MTESGKVMKLNFEGVKIDDKLKFELFLKIFAPMPANQKLF